MPSLIFGHLLTSSNYNDEEEKSLVAGMVMVPSSATFSVPSLCWKLHLVMRKKHSSRYGQRTWAQLVSLKSKHTLEKISLKSPLIQTCPNSKYFFFFHDLVFLKFFIMMCITPTLDGLAGSRHSCIVVSSSLRHCSFHTWSQSLP